MTRFARLRRSEEGFTLIELLVVVAIIALLATFAVPKLFDAINKSKKAPGDADLNTLSSALERYYFDNNSYPLDTAAVTAGDVEVMNALKGGYVKANTTFINGFRKGYVYITDDAGTFYVLIDPRNYAGNMTVTCGAWVEATTATADTFEFDETAAAPTAADLNAGCTATDAAAAALDVGIITN